VSAVHCPDDPRLKISGSGIRQAVSTTGIAVCYPDGDYEYIMSPGFVPAVGSTITRKNQAWTITRVVEGSPVTVYIAPATVEDRSSA